MKLDSFLDKTNPSGPHFIQEHVNGEYYRVWELQAVANRPQILRVTLYTTVTPAAFRARDKALFRSVNGLRNLISQQNRAGQAPMILRKNEDNENEYLSSLKQGFELIPEDDESIVEDDLSDAIDNEETK